MKTQALHLTARRAVEKLLEETGHELELDDFPYLLKLHTIACSIGAAADGDELPLIWPTRVNNILLFPLTLGRAQWLEEKGLPWFQRRQVMADLMLAFILSRAVPLKELWEIQSRRQCKKAIKAWWRNVDCHYSELRMAIDKARGDTDDGSILDKVCGNCTDWAEIEGCTCEAARAQIGGSEFLPKQLFGCYFHTPNEESEKAYYGPLIAMLIREYGNNAEYWLWDAPLELVNSLVDEFLLKVQAEEESMRKSSGATGTAPQPTIAARRIRELRLARNKLRELWSTAK